MYQKADSGCKRLHACAVQSALLALDANTADNVSTKQQPSPSAGQRCQRPLTRGRASTIMALKRELDVTGGSG